MKARKHNYIKIIITMLSLCSLTAFGQINTDKNQFGIKYKFQFPINNPNVELVKGSNNFGLIYGRKMNEKNILCINSYYNRSNLFRKIIGANLNLKKYILEPNKRNNIFFEIGLGHETSFQNNYIEYKKTYNQSSGLPAFTLYTWTTKPKLFYSNFDFGYSLLLKNLRIEPSFGYFISLRNFKNQHLDSFLQNIPLQNDTTFELNKINPNYLEWTNLSFGVNTIIGF